MVRNLERKAFPTGRWSSTRKVNDKLRDSHKRASSKSHTKERRLVFQSLSSLLLSDWLLASPREGRAYAGTVAGTVLSTQSIMESRQSQR
jgi:hypothetical protein